MKWLEQKNIGRHWGGIKQVAQQLSFYVQILNLALIGVVAYHTTITDWCSRLGISITLWKFGCAIVFLLCLAAVLEYKFTIPSFYSFWNQQWWEHDNPMRKEMEALRKEVRSLKKAMEVRNEK